MEAFLCSTHGVRKVSAVRAAENGATTHQLKAMFGWLSVQEAKDDKDVDEKSWGHVPGNHNANRHLKERCFQSPPH